jgi:hypothetical protein
LIVIKEALVFLINGAFYQLSTAGRAGSGLAAIRQRDVVLVRCFKDVLVIWYLNRPVFAAVLT